MLRILQSVNAMDRAGLETMLMNYYRAIDRRVVQFDFLTHRPWEGAYDEEIRSLGGKVFYAPRLYPQNLPSYYKYMSSFFATHPEYRILHSHIDAMSYYPLKAARRSGIPVRIAHSHNTKIDMDLKLPIKHYALKSIQKVANYNCACGIAAGNFMFGDKQFKVIRNAIDLERFAYNVQIREKVRNDLNIQGNLVIGHVGRYCRVKNQMFLLDVFREVLMRNKSSILLLIGKGQYEHKIREKARALGIEDQICLLIDRSDVDRLYQAMDVFVLPSLFEGLPVVSIEAQACGLPCVVSDEISPEVNLTSSVQQFPLSLGASKWADIIIKVCGQRNPNAVPELREAGYDISREAKLLQIWYEDLYKTIVN